MLDDLKMIHERDAQDALGIAEKQGLQLEVNFEIPDSFHPDHVLNVVFAGMGGSALYAQMLLGWPGLQEPFEVIRGYDLPPYVDGNTLVIISSYSGNTEETLSALAQAETKGATIAVIASGGKLAELAKERNYPLALLPNASQPRFGLLAGYKALLSILRHVGLVGDTVVDEAANAASFVRQSVQPWLPTVPTKDNPAKRLALECIGKSAVIYAGPKLFSAAYKWKISFNENAKQIAWCDQFSEFNHNEFLGWTKQPVEKPYAVIELQSSFEHERIQKRFEVTNRLLSGQWPQPHVITAEGNTVLEQLLWSIALGDFVTLYTALLNGLNPSPVELIEKFKHELMA